MNNFKLRDKILLILVLPVLSILFLSTSIFIDKYNEQDRMSKTHNFLELSLDASKLLHSLQDERYYALKYLNSYGKKFTNEFSNQNRKTDINIEILNKFLANLDSVNMSDKLRSALNKYVKDIKQIKDLRLKITNLEVGEAKVREYYSKEIEVLNTFIENLVIISNDGIIAKYAEAYISLSKTIENAHNEKILLEYILEKGDITNNESLSFSALITAQDTHLKVFENLASNKSIKSCKECKEVDNIRRLIFLKNEKAVLLSQIKELAGYGGLIHNFKNYVLRDQDKYLKRFEQKHTRLLRALRKYKRLKGVTREEKRLIKKIQRVFDAYLLAISEVKEYKKTKSIKQIDELILVDDSVALKSISKLEKKIYGVTLDAWTKNSYERIKFLEKEQNKLSDKLSTIIDNNITRINTEYALYVAIISAIFILVFISVVFMTRRISRVIDIFQKNLNNFFSYALREKEKIYLDEVLGRDEFAQMHLNMKKRVNEIEKIIEQDKKVVNEISDVMGKVANGFFEYSIHERGATSEVESLRYIINKMLNRTKLKLDHVNTVLDNYAKSNYTFILDEEQKKGMYGDMGTLYSSTLLLGQSASELIAMITNAGNSLNHSTQTLTASSQKLSLSAQEQASSLEETAASLEQITGNIKNNNENINRMSNIADELNNAAQDGNSLATQTAMSMDDINDKVAAINEAITVIDQIAFQTNILSLNAAVEAATAGEAGKGFAVVAQEVRNLAARSAEAAKEIKDLVESATNKSSEGKSIVDNMIKGYDNLNQKVVETKEIIDNVTSFSKEQELGIIQINQSITLIEQETQENAKTAHNMDELSKEASGLSNELLALTSQANIDEIYLEMVQDMGLRNEVSKYKNDHINFKKRYFNTLDTFETCTVADCKSCGMGKWIISCENEGRNFVHTKEWSELKNHHETVHSKVQKYLDESASKVDNSILKITAGEIEESTAEVFNSLNSVLAVNSRMNYLNKKA